MKLQGRDLSTNMTGDDVALLHTELQKLGFRIQGAETERQRFGRQTSEAVRAFQQAHSLPVTGKVDERTATLINREFDAMESSSFVVHGRVTDENDEALSVVVRAFDRDLRSSQSLGEARSDKNGEYRIEYNAEQFARAEKINADLIVRAFDKQDSLLAESQLLFNAPPEAKIDLIVEPIVKEELSEFEVLMGELEPLLDGASLSELSSDDIAFLVGETGLDRQRLFLVSGAAVLARETELPIAVFYGLARLSVPTELPELLRIKPAVILETLKRAIAEAIIPGSLANDLDDILERWRELPFEQGMEVRREAFVELLNQQTELPLPNVAVDAFDLDADESPRELGTTVTDGRGRFAVSYTAETPDDTDDTPPAERQLQFIVTAPDGTKLQPIQVTITVGDRKIIPVSVTLPTKVDSTPTLAGLKETLNLPDALINDLAANCVVSLADFRDRGGISGIGKLPVPADDPAILALQAHANLNVVSDDVVLNQKLIENQLTSLVAIADLPRSDFVSLVHTLNDNPQRPVGDLAATRLHAEATGTARFFDNVIVGLAADAASGVVSPLTQAIPALTEQFASRTTCRDSESAVSPLAYLTDLLGYAIRHLKSDVNGATQPVSLERLDEQFHQSFGSFSVDGDLIENQLSQVRICIEVLRSFMGTATPNDLEGESEYRFAAYRELLAAMGTSFEELRAARTDDDETRKRLADRIGITTEHLNRLYLTPSDLTEAILEQMFGLPDTNRDVLSAGAKLEDSQNQLISWTLRGASWNRNTDAEGQVHLALSRPDPNLERFVVELFRDAARTELLASGERDTSAGIVILAPENGSLLHGAVEIDYSQDDEMVLSLVPLLQCRRNSFLRGQWQRQDHPELPDNAAPTGDPIIDPDLIGPADLRYPNTSDPAFQLWQTRRVLLDGILDGIKSQREGSTLVETVELEFAPEDIAGLLELQSQTERGEDGTAARLQTLGLSQAGLNRLLALVTLSQTNTPLLEEELNEFDAILTQTRKVALFNDWHTAERQANITLGPDHFRIASEEPDSLPAWRADRSQRRNWQRRLKNRIEQQEIVEDRMREAIRKAEQAALPILRDALLRASLAEGESLEAKAEWVTRHLLIDARADVCMQTTRMAQAIETVQGVVLAARRGASLTVLPALSIDADDFEEEWKWLGSYETWRAAMLLFLYPENLLLPTLRNEQTPGFKQLVKTVRGHRRLTPEQACHAAHQYSQYFKDICSLRVETSCRAKTLIYRDDECRGRVPGAYKDLDYFFGRGTETQAVYWSSIEPGDQSGSEQSYWSPVPGLENVEAVIGAVPYQVVSSNSRYICLFVQVREDDRQKLKLTRYNLEQQRWVEEEPIPLELPERNGRQPTQFGAVAMQRPGEARPHLAIFAGNRIYDRKINPDATGWGEQGGSRDPGESRDDWRMLAPATIGQYFERIWSMVQVDSRNYCLMVKRHHGDLLYRLIGDKDDGYWHPQNPTRTLPPQGRWKGEPIGAFALGSNTLYAFWKEKSILDNAMFAFQPESLEYNPDVSYYRTIEAGTIELQGAFASFYEFEKWLGQVAGLSLSELQVIHGVHHQDLLSFLNVESSVGDQEAIEEEAVRIGKAARSGALGEAWQWVDFMTRRMSVYKVSLEEVLTKLVSHSGKALLFFKRDDTLSSPQKAMSGLERVAPAFTSPSADQTQIITGAQFDDTGAFQTAFERTDDSRLSAPNHTPLTPNCCGPFDITEKLTDADRAIRRTLIKDTFGANSNRPKSHHAYLEEAYYFVPMHLASQLRRRGQYESALDWFRTVYDYTLPDNDRKIYYGLSREEDLSENLQRASDWLDDPLNPHAIAATRANSYTRFTLLAIVQCLVDYADAEFTRDSAESVARARTLYLTTLELLDSGSLGSSTTDSQIAIDTLDSEVIATIAADGAQWLPLWNEAKLSFGRIATRQRLENAIGGVRSAMATNEDLASRTMNALEIVSTAAAKLPISLRLSNLVAERGRRNALTHTTAFRIPEITAAGSKVGNRQGNAVVLGVKSAIGVSTKHLADLDLPFLREPTVLAATADLPGVNVTRPPLVVADEFFVDSTPTNPLAPPPATCRSAAFRATPLVATQLAASSSVGFIPRPGLEFCVPRNPMPSAFRLHAQLNLFKIRNCRNIAGDERELEPYSAPVDVRTGIPRIGASGEIAIPRGVNLPPTPYRYGVLVERARQLVGMAQQMESAFLSALEKRDAEFYNLLRARQEVRLARAGVKLQDLRVKEANDGVTLAGLQRERSEIQQDHFQSLLGAGLLSEEHAAIGFMYAAAAFHTLAGVAGFISAETILSGGANLSSSLAAASSTIASIRQTYASHERREQEWQLQRNLARQDVRIGSQQIKLAKDRVRVVGQERTIADFQAEHANEAVEFLATKFANADLYEFMSEVLEGVYGYFLQQATSVARLAERQLAFERQELPPPMIQSDYWEPPTGLDAGSSIGGESPDRRGITGSARLLQDITRLDQFAFQTDERKLQLTKTFSLARLAPAEFQRFRESGVMVFNTPMALFDQDFPGHFLRLIKRVRTSVIALIPPIEGIKATLTTSGISRVVIDADGSYPPVDAQRPPESVALSSPRDATGLFELLPQINEKLFPFEGMGVDTSWEFQLPKPANHFDFSTIADLLITFEYTALESYDYRRQVIKQLNQSISGDRPFSFRNQFADQWYELHNPTEPDASLEISFTTHREDFPPNLAELKIQHLVLFFSLKDGVNFEVPVTNLRFQPTDSEPGLEGGEATTIQGVISTRRGNAGDWNNIVNEAPNPFGTWTLSLSDPEILEAISKEEIEDILFVITYGAATPEWPA